MKIKSVSSPIFALVTMFNASVCLAGGPAVKHVGLAAPDIIVVEVVEVTAEYRRPVALISSGRKRFFLNEKLVLEGVTRVAAAAGGLTRGGRRSRPAGLLTGHHPTHHHRLGGGRLLPPVYDLDAGIRPAQRRTG